ncbi:MAG: hypothetical protein MK135_01215 [Polyangiaceae bacterium]|nr:hypothetical protein [Polyangiaceae bacterium]
MAQDSTADARTTAPFATLDPSDKGVASSTRSAPSSGVQNSSQPPPFDRSALRKSGPRRRILEQEGSTLPPTSPSAAKAANPKEPLAVPQPPRPATAEAAEADSRSVPSSLSKPYASLTPPGRKSDMPGTQQKQVHQTRSSNEAKTWSDTTEARQWNDSTEARRLRGVCKKHQIALSPSGECLLCRKEAPGKDRGWKFITAIFIAAVVVSAAVAAII